MSTYSRQLKLLAELNAPVVGGGQLSRASEGRADERSLLSGLRERSSLGAGHRRGDPAAQGDYYHADEGLDEAHPERGEEPLGAIRGRRGRGGPAPVDVPQRGSTRGSDYRQGWLPGLS
ncbi:DnaB-like helicase C-terminal domain-containing protein [Actinopolymorpha pittospori]|uniref:DnaB-like helicase C-terminal domain-containing protein n=1 Tax=Actinopolymorpha pittospori TaxID=648752 RepID=UPI001789B51B